jgi:carboxyl-terminal processing protease
MKTIRMIWVNLLLVLVLVSCLGQFADAKSSGDYYENVTRLNNVLLKIDRQYVVDVPPESLTNAALEGIRKVLDPHTVVFSPKDYDDLKVSTEGEFGGLGITIAIRENILTIITPLSGTPAFNMGLRAGDRIIKIGGESTKGITIEKAVEKLRGQVGTQVTITIARFGIPEPMEYTITRAKIMIHSIPYSGMIDEDVGYIKVAQFAKRTAEDIEDAIKALKKEGMKKLVLDLRFNPGGLLSQAVAVSELFLDKGNLVVSTKGRTHHSEAHSSRNGILPKDFPFAVLINEGSASASEIVAGAVQDWDRGIIVGKTSFGKGSVQTIIPLSSDGYALKMTTAFYYLPMGRCINKPEGGITESIMLSDSGKVYQTKGRRTMYGGGGITPDVEVGMNDLPWFAQALERTSSFFKFAVNYRPIIEASNQKIDLDWNVTPEVEKAFKEFVMQDTILQNLKTNTQTALELFKELVIKEQKASGIDADSIVNVELRKNYESLLRSMLEARQQELVLNREYIRDALKREFVTAVLGEQGRIAFTLRNDAQVLKAVETLKDQAAYKKILGRK